MLKFIQQVHTTLHPFKGLSSIFNTQHIATCRKSVPRRAQHVAFNNVSDMLAGACKLLANNAAAGEPIFFQYSLIEMLSFRNTSRTQINRGHHCWSFGKVYYYWCFLAVAVLCFEVVLRPTKIILFFFGFQNYVN